MFDVYFMLFNVDYWPVTCQVYTTSFDSPKSICHVCCQMANQLQQFVADRSTLVLIQLPTRGDFVELSEMISIKQPRKVVAFLSVKAPKESRLADVLSEEAYFVAVLGMCQNVVC